jgi:integrase/recombinase XerD
MTSLRSAVDQYLALRRGLGFKLQRHESYLHAFAAYMDQQAAETLTVQIALDWAQLPRHTSQVNRAARLNVVRDFAKYFVTIDPRTEVPPAGMLKGTPTRSVPYIYPESELIALIEEARRLTPAGGLRPWTYATLFGLICATGMRVGETTALDDGDVDLSNALITIRKSKFGKTRKIPIHPSTQEELHAYVKRRRRMGLRSIDGSFFISDRGSRLKGGNVREAFVTASCHIGLRVRTKRFGHGPRLHDIRHTFAVRALTNWHRTGVNVQPRLPALAAYLGHTNISDSYWYLSAVPELLDAVNERLDRYLEDLP